MTAEVDALLERLVAQFESPYDFLRELVQNAMDAGSDRVEVTLESHPIPDSGGDEVVYELTILDTGEGMDEAIIDRELTRLFSSGKSGDRTMAGGFGIGFVSVFAWEPEAVLVHTGRAGESWELLFHTDRSFEKVALEDPIEGTTVSLFRRGRSGEREAIAEAIRDSLWRWARFCPLEVSFEDLDGDAPAELIQDAPEPQNAIGLSRTDVRGEATLRVSFAVPPSAVFLRRGLVLAEGGPRLLLGKAAEPLGSSCDHLQIWADSPQLRTTLARDKVIDDEGRAAVQARLVELVGELRQELVRRLEILADTQPTRQGEVPSELHADGDRPDPAWSPERHAIYATLHAHLQVEAPHLGSTPQRAAILRDLAHGRAVSLQAALERMGGRPLLLAPPAAGQGGSGVSGDPASEGSPIHAGIQALVVALRPTTFPVLAAVPADDRPWLDALLDGASTLGVVPIERAIARAKVRAGEGTGLCGVVQSLLRGLGCTEIEVQVAAFEDVQGRPDASPLFGPEVVGAAVPLAFHGGPHVPAASLRRRRLWLNHHSTLVQAATDRFVDQPLLAGLTLTLAVVAHLDEPPEPGDVAKLAQALDRDAQAVRA